MLCLQVLQPMIAQAQAAAAAAVSSSPSMVQQLSKPSDRPHGYSPSMVQQLSKPKWSATWILPLHGSTNL